MKIAIQGAEGSFHAQAAKKWYGDDCELVCCASFRDVFDAFSAGDADAIVTAVENTVYGSINQVYQLIADCKAPIIGEIKLPIAQQLIAKNPVDPATITTIYSHPIALAQCHDTLRRISPQARHVEFSDTAAAVAHVRDLDDPHAAAVAGTIAADTYVLPIIAPDVHDFSHNITRFLVLDPAAQTASDTSRASVLVTTNHTPGALAEVLGVFSDASINLVKLQSQPIPNQPWQYHFFIVADGSASAIKACCERITADGHSVRLLGQYRAAL